MRRKALLWATAAFALLVGAAPAAADSTLYLQGTGSVQGARFKNFVVVEPGQPPRGWLSVRGAPVQHATATCTSVTDGAATIGYRIDIGADPGHGWLVSVRYPGGPGDGGTVLYAGTVTDPPAACPAPEAPPPADFKPAGSGPVTEGSLAKSATPPSGPASIVDVQPADGGTRVAESFPAFAGLNGADARAVTLTIAPKDGSMPVFTTAMTFDAGGLDAMAQVPALDPGEYVATWTLERADGSSSTVVSGFRVRGAKRIRDADKVECRALGQGRHICKLLLARAATTSIPFRVRRGRKVVVKRRVRVHNGFGRIPGVGRLPRGRYVLELLLGSGRQPRVLARVRFTLR